MAGGERRTVGRGSAEQGPGDPSVWALVFPQLLAGGVPGTRLTRENFCSREEGSQQSPGARRAETPALERVAASRAQVQPTALPAGHISKHRA